MSFEHFGLRKEILRAIKDAGFVEPSPIQAQAIPHILEERDLIGQAQTGTGKTAAFGLPILSMMHGDAAEVLIIAPTRELASQISDELWKFGRYLGYKTATIYGGQSISRQIELVKRGSQIIVATPGRLLDHLKNERLGFFAPRYIVLDEADEMLDMGFLEDIEEIFTYLPQNRQTLMFSATMPEEIKRLAKRILTNPVEVKIEAKEVTNENIEQFYYVIEEHERTDAIVRLIDHEEPAKAVIFCRTKRDTDELTTTLLAKGYSCKALHGDMEQRQREEAIKSFRDNKIEMLVATDVAARGLDFSDVSHVFNYHIPLDPESYVHRIGRTGRAGRKGKAVTLLTPLEFKELYRIKKLTKAQLYHEEIPSIDAVQQKKYRRMVEQIKQTHINESATEIYNLLASQMDSSTMALKLISKLIVRYQVEGPNRIGLTTEKIVKLLEKNSGKGEGGSRGGFGGKGRSSNRGGGGYRGNREGGGARGNRREGGQRPGGRSR
ncbi:MAG: DEAD/DEAH box helicase [Campylobacterales bacterium]